MKRWTTLATTTATVTLLATGCSSGSATENTVTRTITKTVAAGSPTSAGDRSDAATDGAAGDASSSTSAAAAPDACSLLTLAEAEKVAGTTLLKPEGAGNQGSSAAVQCLFTGPTSGPTAQVEIYVGDGARQQLTIDRDNLGHKFTTVPGIGDECRQEDNFIFVRKGSLWASLRLVRLNDAKDNVRPMQTGARQLAARLP